MPPADIIVQATTGVLVSFAVFTFVSQILQRGEHHRQAVRDIEDRTLPAMTTTRAPTTGTRDGGPFTTFASCPRCGDYSVHPMRLPNPDPPHFHDVPHEEVRTFGGLLAYSMGGPTPDRWDERPYEIVRTCNTCGKEWGHV